MKINIDKIKEEFKHACENWKDTVYGNKHIYEHFDSQIDKYDFLKAHCDIISKYNLGYGEPAFRYLWLLVFSQINKKSKFLEIGVFKGSILALSQLISNELNLELESYGLTPLNASGDKYSNYAADDFEQCISYLYHKLQLSADNTTIIQGLSTTESVKQSARENGPYDVVYIDGGHDYETVINDINLCDDILKVGGIMVMDDASSLLNFDQAHPGFKGHMEVGLAIRDRLDTDESYTHLFACGHNRVWIKNK